MSDSPGRIRRMWNWLREPSMRWSAGALLVAGIFGGIIFWGGFNTAMEWTNRTEFCLGCHEMARNVGEEWRRSAHFQNPSGVRAGCADCHVPKDWVPKLVRKIYATNELYHHFMGTVDTPEKFNEKRRELAQRVWTTMEKNDSRECRNCHSYQSMNFHKQTPRGAEKMQEASLKGQTCIECHKGIAHQLPKRDD